MNFISFAYTTPALLAGHKTVTRRHWKDSYARRFGIGDYLQAWDKSPRAGGKRVGVIKLTCDPYQERTSMMPDADFEAEGFRYLAAHTDSDAFNMNPTDLSDARLHHMDLYWRHWKRSDQLMWVVRFEVVE